MYHIGTHQDISGYIGTLAGPIGCTLSGSIRTYRYHIGTLSGPYQDPLGHIGTQQDPSGHIGTISGHIRTYRDPIGTYRDPSGHIGTYKNDNNSSFSSDFTYFRKTQNDFQAITSYSYETT